jgi:RNA recognition motif-containing protein
VKKEIMEAKLFVGNLAYTTTEDDLKALFAQAGGVKSVALIKDRETGRSKGFAFVEFETQVDAEKAISLLDGKEFQGRALKVNLARPREDKPRGGGGYGDRRPPRGDGNRRPRQGNSENRY